MKKKSKFIKKTNDLNHQKFGPMLDAFTRFASDKLGLQSMPNIQLSKEPMETSFGGYSPSDQSIVVVSKNRHPMDVFRTVAHELVHHKQKEDGKLGQDISKEGSTGSPQENEANSEAGKLLRWYAKANPEMFKLGYVTEDTAPVVAAKNKVLFVTGAPGSDSESLVSATQHGFTPIDGDALLNHLVRRNNRGGKAPNLPDKVQQAAINNHNGLVVHSIGDNPQTISGLTQELSKIGYEPMLVNVSVKDSVSKRRNNQTAQQGGQAYPEDVRRQLLMSARNAQIFYKKYFGNAYLNVRNNDDDPQRQEEMQAEHDNMYTMVRNFASTPASNPIATGWQNQQMKRMGIPAPQQPASYNQTTPINQSSRLVTEDDDGSRSLKNWFAKSRAKDGTKGWVQVGGRYDGEPCARQPGQTTTPKCRPSSEAASMTKKEKEYAFKKKQREDPNQPEKRGAAKPTMVKTYKTESYEMTRKKIQEKVDACYHKVKSRYKVWPSAYASGALVKCRKVGAKNWGNKSVDEAFDDFAKSVTDTSKREWGKTSLANLYKRGTPGQEGTVQQEDSVNTTPNLSNLGGASATRGTLPVTDGIGPETSVFRPMTVSGYGGGYSIAESVANWANQKTTQRRFLQKYGKDAQKKLYEACVRLSQSLDEEAVVGGASYGKDPADTMGMIGNQNKDDVREEMCGAVKRRNARLMKEAFDEGEAPQKFKTAYKLFRKGRDGELRPLFVDAAEAVPVGKWLTAKAGQPGKREGSVKSKLGDLAYRPGWHSGDLPVATHIGGRSHKDPKLPPDYRPDDQIWAEVHVPDDVDWQKEANARAKKNKKGEVIPSTAHITDQVPLGGHYRYKTNPNMTGNWIISGAMRINRVLGDDEVKAINDKAGVADLPRMSGLMKEDNDVVDLGKKREDKQLRGFNKKFMGDVADRAQKMNELIASHREKGLLPFDVGTRFSTDHSRRNKLPPMKVTGYYINPKNPENDYGYHVERRMGEDKDDVEKSMVSIKNPGLEKLHGPEKWASLVAGFQPVGKLQSIKESAAWQRKAGKDPKGGLNKKGVESYRREHPGSKLQTAVTTEPSKLKPGSKKAKRRLSFCRRMKGMKEKLTSSETARDPDSRINKALRKWNC